MMSLMKNYEEQMTQLKSQINERESQSKLKYL